MATLVPRVVVITRATELTALLHHHGTLEQARFFLSTRGRDLESVSARHALQEAAERRVLAAIPGPWRRARVDRGDLPRFLFEPEDVVVAVGQDGLVANVAKYLDGQRVIGIDPEPGRNPGILVPHPAEKIDELLTSATAEHGALERRTMVEARIDDGQVLRAVNEIFVGHRSHQSARYRLQLEGPPGEQDQPSWRSQRPADGWHAPLPVTGPEERQSSSGVVVTTGTGATGWASSIFRSRRCATDLSLPGPGEARLCFFVREAWPSPATGVSLTDGSLGPYSALSLTSEMDEGGVIFGDGIEADPLALGWGQTVRIALSDRALHLVH